jgi:hypothetical protein
MRYEEKFMQVESEWFGERQALLDARFELEGFGSGAYRRLDQYR